MHYNLEFGGGLGDVLDQCYHKGAYGVLDRLRPEDTATVHLVTHNPFARELFLHHPKATQITVLDHGYWQPGNDHGERLARKMPPAGMNAKLPTGPEVVTFYPNPESSVLLDSWIGKPYVVLSAGAGTADRSIPGLVLRRIVAEWSDLSTVPLVAVGRNYERTERTSEPFVDHQQVTQLVDQLDVPGVCKLIQHSAGLITCHSSMSILAWRLRLPNLLVYPKAVWEKHAPQGNPDHWMRGARYHETVHSSVGELTHQHLTKFLDLAVERCLTITPRTTTA